jgi:hypothetical protein
MFHSAEGMVAAIVGSRGDCESIIRIYINVSIRVLVLEGCQSRGGTDTKGTVSSSATLRLGASPRRSYLAVMAMFARPASLATVAMQPSLSLLQFRQCSEGFR